MDKKTVNCKKEKNNNTTCALKILAPPQTTEFEKNATANLKQKRLKIKARIEKVKHDIAKAAQKLNAPNKPKKPIWNSRLNQPIERKKFKKPETNWREIHSQSIMKMRRDRAFYNAQMQVYQEIRRENIFKKEQTKLKELKMNNKSLPQHINRPANCAWFVPV